MFEEIKETTVDNEEYYLVPKDEFELHEVVDDETVTEDEHDGIQLSGVLVGAGLAAVVGLIGLIIKKLINCFRKKKSVDSSKTSDSSDKVKIIDDETDEVILEDED